MDMNIAIFFVLLLFFNLVMIPAHLFNMDKAGRIQFFWIEQFKEIEWYGKILIILVNVLALPAIIFNIVITTIIRLIGGK